MEELLKVFTDLAEKRIEAYKKESIDELLDYCKTNKKKHPMDETKEIEACIKAFVHAAHCLEGEMLGFIDGVTFFGDTVDPSALMEKHDLLLEEHQNDFYTYMKGTYNDTH